METINQLTKSLKEHFISTYGNEYVDDYYMSYETNAVSEPLEAVDGFISYFKDRGKSTEESFKIYQDYYLQCRMGTTSGIDVEERNNLGVEDKDKYLVFGGIVFKQYWIIRDNMQLS